MIDTPIVISKVTSVSDNKPARQETTWGAIVKACSTPTPRGKLSLAEYLAAPKDAKDAQKDGKAIIAGEFNKSGTRSKSDLKNRRLLVLDLDDGFYTFAQLVKALSGIECLVHTSYSHSEEKGKYRVFILLDTPITEDIDGTIDRMIDYFENLLGKHIDDKSRVINQIFFTPSCPTDAVHLYRVQHIQGEPLKVTDFSAPEPPRERIAEARQSTGTRPGDDYNRRGSWRELLEAERWRFYFSGRGCTYWTRPGKARGISGVTFDDNNVFYCHSSAPEVFPFEGGKAYNLFTAYALVNHGGDYSAAAKQLAMLGYGGKEKSCSETKYEALKHELPNTEEFDPYQIMSLADSLRQLDIQTEFIVEGLIPKGMITVLYARSGMGKSTLLTQVCNAVSTGAPFMGLQTMQVPCVYLDYENPISVIVDRLKKFEAVPFHIWHSGNEPPPPALDSNKFQQLKNLNPGLIIIDTLKACNDADENSSREMKIIMDRAKQLRAWGHTVIILHHTNKQSDSTFRGSSVIQDQCDHCLVLHKVKQGDAKESEADDDEINTYRFGTKFKTRVKPFRIFLEFDLERELFKLAEDPEQQTMKRLQEIIKGIYENGTANQTAIIEAAKNEISEKKARALLKKGEGRLWEKSKSIGRHEYHYRPIDPSGVSGNSAPLYSAAELPNTPPVFEVSGNNNGKMPNADPLQSAVNAESGNYADTSCRMGIIPSDDMVFTEEELFL